MADEFDRLLAGALAPPERGSDRDFARKVQLQVRLEQRLSAERRAVLSRFTLELAALGAIAAGFVLLGSSPAAARLSYDSPEISLSALLAAFSFILVLFTAGDGSDGRRVPGLPERNITAGKQVERRLSAAFSGASSELAHIARINRSKGEP